MRDSFVEYQVEWEDDGEMRGFDCWADARTYLGAELVKRFRPFCVSCVKYGPRETRTVWEVEWTDASLRATREDARWLREVRAGCVLDVLRWSLG